MATEAQQPLKISLEAAADLSALQYTFVKRDTNGRAVAVAAATDIPIGILQNKPKALGQMAEIVVIGISKVLVTTTGTQFTTFLDLVGFDATGKAQKATATGLGGAYVQGTKLAVGQIAPIGGTGVGIPVSGDTSRVAINCLNPTPAT
jgi:hypothetical protein